MAEKRTLGAAIEMTPAKLAFIQGQGNAEVVSPAGSVAKPEVKTIDVEIPQKEPESAKESAPRTARRANRRPSQAIPEASEVLDQVLVPVTIRLPHRTAQALRRAYLEQRLKHAKPDTQQEIVEEALSDWLSRHEFLE